MACPQVVEGGTASNMEGSCEYISLSSLGELTGGCPPAWGLGEVLTTPHHKNRHVKNTNTCFKPGLILWYDLSNEKGT